MAVKKIQRCTRAQPQKPIQQKFKNKRQQKQEPSASKKSKKAVIIAQEIKFARLLTNNDKKVRDKVLKNLKRWLTVRSKSSFTFTEPDFMRLWTGLFYCMWMSDKLLIQEELAESLSKIVHCFDSKDVVLLYTMCTLKTLGTEWIGIDQYRIDKFSMLVRRIIRQTFQICKNKLWDKEWIKGISNIIETLLLDSKITRGFDMHITELYLEELSKISCGDIPEDTVTDLIKPFAEYLIRMDDERQIRHVMKNIFRYLIFQSDIGMDYMEKFEAWRAAGFPTGSIDAMEKIEVSDEEDRDDEEEDADNDDDHNNSIENEENDEDNKERPLDPRAGRVDVELPQIPFNPNQIVKLLKQYKFHPSSTTKSRRQVLRLIREFTELSEGKMPLGIKQVHITKTPKKNWSAKSAAARLLQFEKALYSDTPTNTRKRKKNGQVIEDENAFDNDKDDTAVENNRSESEESESPKKKKKTPNKTIAIDNLVKSNLKDTNRIIAISKKKKNKIEKKVDSNPRIEVQESNFKLKKHTSPINNNENSSKKIKVKRNGVNPASPLNIITPVKRKKPRNIASGGKWDVSDNTDSLTHSPLINSDKESPVKTTNTSVTNKTDKKNDIAPKKQATWLEPVLKKLGNEQMRTPNSSRQQSNTIADSSSKKRVKIVLQRNTAQHTSEYIQQIRKSPAIPFDANKKPSAGVLKASPIPSPINPFYKKTIKYSLL